ncbi:Putative glycosyltransferase [Candidatus Arthromitus sp. SFB-2]|nr:Putative glycosyltransferase [Candidatus Arthromitus sp. SFB-2]
MVFTGKVNDDELKFLYKNASVFVYPSLYEGFGLPPLEAMSYGVRTIVSDVTCLKEVLGDSSEYFPPKDYKYLSSILNGIFKSNNQNESYDYNYTLNKYSWRKCANETIKIYNEIMKGV